MVKVERTRPAKLRSLILQNLQKMVSSRLNLSQNPIIQGIMMRLKYHLDLPDEGLIVVESEPQMRSLILYYSQRFASRFPLPYLQFTIRYIKINGKLHFPGIYGSGLRITGSLKPLSSIHDPVFFLPMGEYAGGRVCTPHEMDMRGFDNLNELVNTIVGVWYGLNHSLTCDQWNNTKLENFGNLRWTKSTNPYIKAIIVGREHWLQHYPVYRNYGNNYGNPTVPSFDMEFPAEMPIVDEQWGQKIEIRKAARKARRKQRQ